MAAKQRRLWVVYAAAPNDWVQVNGEWDSDDALRATYLGLVAVHMDAWIKHERFNDLPPWWQLVDSIRTEGLTPRELITWPGIDAALAWAGLALGEQTHAQDTWRTVQHGPDKGRNIRSTEERRTGVMVSGQAQRTVQHPEAFAHPTPAPHLPPRRTA